MSAALTTRIPIRNRSGAIVDEKEVATYAGLLARAHEEGLTAIDTELVQVPSDINGLTAIVRATAQTKRGTFTGLGDASPDNVNRRIVPHLIRMAETRAKARALRDAVNIGLVAAEELGGEEAPEPDDRTNVRPMRPRANRSGASMTTSQRRYLFRLLAEDGHQGDAATRTLLASAEVDSLDEITKSMASRLIDRWKGGVNRG